MEYRVEGDRWAGEIPPSNRTERPTRSGNIWPPTPSNRWTGDAPPSTTDRERASRGKPRVHNPLGDLNRNQDQEHEIREQRRRTKSDLDSRKVSSRTSYERPHPPPEDFFIEKNRPFQELPSFSPIRLSKRRNPPDFGPRKPPPRSSRETGPSPPPSYERFRPLPEILLSENNPPFQEPPSSSHIPPSERLRPPDLNAHKHPLCSSSPKRRSREVRFSPRTFFERPRSPADKLLSGNKPFPQESPSSFHIDTSERRRPLDLNDRELPPRSSSPRRCSTEVGYSLSTSYERFRTPPKNSLFENHLLLQEPPSSSHIHPTELGNPPFNSRPFRDPLAERKYPRTRSDFFDHQYAMNAQQEFIPVYKNREEKKNTKFNDKSYSFSASQRFENYKVRTIINGNPEEGLVQITYDSKGAPSADQDYSSATPRCDRFLERENEPREKELRESKPKSNKPDDAESKNISPKRKESKKGESKGTVSKKTDPKEIDPKRTDPKEKDSKGEDPKETDPKETGPKREDPKGTDFKDTDAKEKGPKETDPKREDPKGTDFKDTDAKEKGPKETDPKREDSKGPDFKDTDPKETDLKEKGPKEINPGGKDPKKIHFKETDPEKKNFEGEDPEGEDLKGTDLKKKSREIEPEFSKLGNVLVETRGKKAVPSANALQPKIPKILRFLLLVDRNRKQKLNLVRRKRNKIPLTVEKHPQKTFPIPSFEPKEKHNFLVRPRSRDGDKDTDEDRGRGGSRVTKRENEKETTERRKKYRERVNDLESDSSRSQDRGGVGRRDRDKCRRRGRSKDRSKDRSKERSSDRNRYSIHDRNHDRFWNISWNRVRDGHGLLNRHRSTDRNSHGDGQEETHRTRQKKTNRRQTTFRHRTKNNSGDKSKSRTRHNSRRRPRNRPSSRREPSLSSRRGRTLNPRRGSRPRGRPETRSTSRPRHISRSRSRSRPRSRVRDWEPRRIGDIDAQVGLVEPP